MFSRPNSDKTMLISSGKFFKNSSSNSASLFDGAFSNLKSIIFFEENISIYCSFINSSYEKEGVLERNISLSRCPSFFNL